MTLAVETPQSKDDPKDVKVEEIPLPPAALWSELENSGQTEGPGKKSAPRQPLPAERLSFVKAPAVEVPLQYPFVRDGRTIDTVTVRRLTVGELGDLLDLLAENFDNYDIYAVMTGLPAPVLRGLIDVDGEKVGGVCYDFLPLVFRPADQTPAESSST